jgi:3-deoxy-D-manno-octulosonic-acid transferase
LEPARLGCPFVSGPHVDHWPIYGAFVEAQATRLVNDTDDLADLLRQALEGSSGLSEMADRAQSLAGQLDAGSAALAPRLLDLMA